MAKGLPVDHGIVMYQEQVNQAKIGKTSMQNSMSKALSDEIMSSYLRLLAMMFDLIQCRVGEKFTSPSEGWKYYSEALSIKFFHHMTSVYQLGVEPTTTFEEVGFPLAVDHSSVQVIIRAAFETYLVYYYIYCAESESLSEFRYQTWKLGGLIDRQKLVPATNEYREQQRSEAASISELRAQISASPHLAWWTVKQQEQVKNGKWRTNRDWSDLATNAGFHKTYFDNIYSHLCGYGHSSYISALQISQARSIAEQFVLAERDRMFGLDLLAKFILAFCQTSTTASQLLDNNPEGKALVTRWAFTADDLKHLYPTPAKP